MNERTEILLLVFVLLVAVFTAMNQDRIQETIARVASRGIRNNNPGNIRISSTPWKGKVPVQQNTDGEFEQFVEPFFGIRAIARDLMTKSRRGLKTIREIISVYAPPTENNTEAYIQSVARQTGLDPDREINVELELVDLVDAIMVHENGGHDFPDPLIRQAVSAA